MSEAKLSPLYSNRNDRNRKLIFTQDLLFLLSFNEEVEASQEKKNIVLQSIRQGISMGEGRLEYSLHCFLIP